MRDKKYKGMGKKPGLRTLGVLLASVMVLSMGSSQLVLAGQGEASEKTEASEEKEERAVIYLDGKSGDDANPGDSRDTAVRSFSRAARLAGDYGLIRISGTVTVEDETWKLPDGVSVRRAEGFEGALVKVNKSLVLKNIRLYEEDITGEGTVEGAVQKEKVYVPRALVMEEPAPLSELALTKCQGDGVFSWENGDYVPAEYETVCRVIFHPYDVKSVDYSKEKGWDEESRAVVREVTVQVASLKPAKEPAAQEPTPQATPEAVPETTPEPTPEAAPETTPEPTPEAALETTPEPTPEAAPETTPEAAPETSPEAAPDAAPEAAPEKTPEGTPEAGTETDQEDASQSGPKEEVPGAAPDADPGVTPEGETQAVPETGETQENGGESGLPEDVRTAALEAGNLIDYLPSEIDCLEAVEAVVNATKAYEALSPEQKALLGTQAPDKLKVAQDQAVKVNRQCNGVTIEGDFPWYIQFRVELHNNKDDVSVLEDRNVDTFISPYEMQLWNLMDDSEYKLDGQQVRVTMPAPDMQMYNQLVVVHYLEDGTVEYITPIYNKDGTISFVTTSFSPYNIAGSKVLVGNTDKLYTSKGTSPKLAGNISGTSSGKKSGSSGNRAAKSSTSKKPALANRSVRTNPRTGDDQMPVLYIVLGVGAVVVLAGAAAGYAGHKRKQKNKKKK